MRRSQRPRRRAINIRTLHVTSETRFFARPIFIGRVLYTRIVRRTEWLSLPATASSLQ